jgi:hypothetical protein
LAEASIYSSPNVDSCQAARSGRTHTIRDHVHVQDVSADELDGTFEDQFRKAHDLSNDIGGIAARPNLEKTANHRGVVVLGPEVCDVQDVSKSQLSADRQSRFRDVHDIAGDIDPAFVAGYPNFHQGANVYGCVFLRDVPEFDRRDVPALALFTPTIKVTTRHRTDDDVDPWPHGGYHGTDTLLEYFA